MPSERARGLPELAAKYSTALRPIPNQSVREKRPS